MSTPALHLDTSYVRDERGRIVRTREPDSSHGAWFVLSRSVHTTAWATHAAISDAMALELDRLAREEPPSHDLREPPTHAERYLALISQERGAGSIQTISGPVFVFPERIEPVSGVVEIHDEAALNHHMKGWLPGEIAAGRAPVMAVIADGFPVSACCCARLTDKTAEAGLDTAEAFRRRGFAVRVTAAWALAIRASGRVPMYTTAWTNEASRGVARKLGLIQYAVDWRVW
jgi:hypothetical protein